MKLLSYNIQEGGGGRLERIAGVIRRERPDAIALQEVTSQEHALALAHELDMELVIGEATIPCRIAWLSRLPIRRRESHRLPALSKGLLEIEVEWMGSPLRLFTTHPASRHNPQTPADEIPVILDVLRRASDTLHILTGDLNALRPGDPVGRPPSGEEKRGDAKEGAARQAIQSVLEAGYTDCYRTLHPHAHGYTYPSTGPWLRLDYIFASPRLTMHLHSCDVARDEKARRASDHVPVWAEFN